MKDKWNYAGLGQVVYGAVLSYEAAAQWLDHPGWTVEDWGCGCAYARNYFHQAKYIGIDGSQNEYADLCRVDVSTRDSRPDGILLRHVLEHNENWRELLANAMRCAQQRLVLVFFRAFGTETRVLYYNSDPKYPGVPDLQFRREDITDLIDPILVKTEVVPPDTLFFCEKRSKVPNTRGALDL